MDSDVDSELRSDFTDYLDHISQKKVCIAALVIEYYLSWLN